MKKFVPWAFAVTHAALFVTMLAKNSFEPYPVPGALGRPSPGNAIEARFSSWHMATGMMVAGRNIHHDSIGEFLALADLPALLLALAAADFLLDRVMDPMAASYAFAGLWLLLGSAWWFAVPWLVSRTIDTMRRPKRVGPLLLGVALGLIPVAQGCATRRDLEARRFQLAGPNARNCGHLKSGQEMGAARACAEQALAAKSPFYVGVEGMAIDSYVVDVLVSSPGGKLTWLRLDSDTTGSSQLIPRPELLEWPCASVTFSSDRGPGGGLFTCVEPNP